MPRGRKPNNDPFKDLDTEFKDTIANVKDNADLRLRISKIALDQANLEKAKKDDQDLAQLKEQVKVATEPYREGTKQNKLRILFIRRVLQDRGQDVGEPETV